MTRKESGLARLEIIAGSKMAGFGLLKDRLEAYKCCANDVIHFKLVRQEPDLYDDRTTFKPEMTHQIFGEHEGIFGYKDLVVQLFYSAGRLTTYLNIKYSERVRARDAGDVEPDDVHKQLSQELPPGYTENLDDFCMALQKEASFRPFGELLHSYTVTEENQERHFEIYKTTIEAPGFREYHERLQTFLLFYVDAASYIDVDDSRWNFYLVFEKYQLDGSSRYAIVAYMTVYDYYAYPARIRPRISQVLTLPPFQKQGHGAELLQAFYRSCFKRSEIRDITVEDPSEEFQRLRDFVDARNCMQLPAFQPEELKKGWSEEMAAEAQRELKLSRRQARRVYEILRLRVTDVAKPDEFRDYRLEIKKRLYVPFQKNGRDYQKLSKVLKPEELNQTLSAVSTEQRHSYLEKAFNELLDTYRRVLRRLT